MRDRFLIHSDKVKKDENGDYYHDDAYVIHAKAAEHIMLGRIKTGRWWRPEGLITDSELREILRLIR